QKYSGFTDAISRKASQSGVQMGLVKDYFTHILDLSKPEDQERFKEFLLAKQKNFQSGFTRDRIFDTIKQAQAAGFHLKNPNVSQDVLQYANSIGTQIAANESNNTLNQLLPKSAIKMT